MKEELKRDPQVTSEIEAASGPVRTLVRNKINVLEKIRLTVATAIKKKQAIPVFNNLMPITCSMEILQLAYANIKSNKGSMTPGTQNQTGDEMSLERIQNLHVKLKEGTYVFPDVRRMWVPKPGKNVDWKIKENLIASGRPLGMPDFDAKVVQEAIRITLNAIYEPIFDTYNVSFGFRPLKGCHHAVSNIINSTQGMRTIIEGDIKGAFNNLNHETLIEILRKRILDEKFLNLIYKSCKAGIFDQLQNTKTDSLLGVPQGGIASPLFWNIYMHEFDKFVTNEIGELITTINSRQERGKFDSKIYKALIYQITKYRKKYDALTKDVNKKLSDLSPEARNNALNYLAEVKRLKKIQLKTPSKDPSRSIIRSYYVRYADDWIYITNAKPVLAIYIRNKIAAYLKTYLGLTLSLEKTKITDLQKETAQFLGFSIKSPRNSKISITSSGVLKRVTGQKNSIGIDKKRLLARFEWRHFFINKKPREQPAWSVLSDYEIVNKYNATIRGLVNYYAPIITTRSTLNYFVYILEYSCYKTLCQKHRTSIRKLIKKHGNPLKATVINKIECEENTEKSINLLTVKTYWKILQPTCDNIKENLIKKVDSQIIASSDFLNNAKTYWRTTHKFNNRCVICGSLIGIEMHHIRHVRSYPDKAKQGFEKIHNLLNRKQVPVCHHHHVEIHKGNYDSISLSELYDTRIATVENFIRFR